jgi:hypothetical protein
VIGHSPKAVSASRKPRTTGRDDGRIHPVKGVWTIHASAYGPDRGFHATHEWQRTAVAIAPFKGRPGLTVHGSRAPSLRDDQPIVRSRPGVQPPVSDMPGVIAPPRADLALHSPRRRLRDPDLGGLDRIDWSAFRPATELPELITRFEAIDMDDEDWPEYERPHKCAGPSRQLLSSDSGCRAVPV